MQEVMAEMLNNSNGLAKLPPDSVRFGDLGILGSGQDKNQNASVKITVDKAAWYTILANDSYIQFASNKST